MQTADTIVVKKSELDAYKKAESMDPKEAGSWQIYCFIVSTIVCVSVSFFFLLSLGCWTRKAIPTMERQELKALPAADPAAPALPGQSANAHLVNSHAEVKQSLEKFTESLHQKAVQVTGWLASVDKASSARAQSLLAITIFQSVFLVWKVLWCFLLIV